jgi:hypothetical protein
MEMKRFWWLEQVAWDRSSEIFVFLINVELNNLEK